MTYDPNETRDPHGRWTRGGGGDSGEVERHLLDPRVIDVSGDEWNRKTAERLEKEYAAVRPEIDAIATQGVEKGASVSQGGEDDEDDDPPITPEQWSDLSGSQQEEAEQQYKDSHLDQEKNYVFTSWLENGENILEAKHTLAKDDDFKSDFVAEFLSDREENDEPRIPFSAGDLAGAINIEPGDSYDDPPEITFDDKYLDKPEGFAAAQMELPGIEPQKPADFLTPKMREQITTALLEKFEDEAKTKAEVAEPPEYLNEEAETNVSEAWGNMDEDEQFKYAMENVSSLKDAEGTPARAATTDLAWPSKFDPLNLTSGQDYTRTQALAKYIADKRGAQLITERVGDAKWKPRDQFLGSDEDYKKLYEQPDSVGRKKDQAWTDRMLKELQSADLKLWSGWKGSSTNSEGRLLQVAASDELGGRIREAKAAVAAPDPGKVREIPELNAETVNGFTRLSDVKVEKNGAASTTVSPTVANNWNGTTNNAPQGIDKKESIDYANKAYAAIGGYEGVKAALRAKWETTQYLLDRADIPVVQAYRGITMEHKLKGDAGANVGDFNPPHNGLQKNDVGTEFDLKTLAVGSKLTTSSGKVITKVSTDDLPSGYAPGVGTWKYSQPKGSQSRIVLRAEVPRTAVVSIPAYGVNVKSEQEVVVAGAAWKGWDAWSGRAPTFEEVPMHTKAKS